MHQEIEHKFWIKDPSTLWPFLVSGVVIQQGYLSFDKKRTVRVRLQGNSQAFLTIKGEGDFSRPEFEYPIPFRDATDLLSMCDGLVIVKTRYRVILNNKQWEIDFFQGDYRGLVVAELEVASEDEQFEIPEVFGEVVDVTRSSMLKNANMAQRVDVDLLAMIKLR